MPTLAAIHHRKPDQGVVALRERDVEPLASAHVCSMVRSSCSALEPLAAESQALLSQVALQHIETAALASLSDLVALASAYAGLLSWLERPIQAPTNDTPQRRPGAALRLVSGGRVVRR